jgi:hypothetical protein
LYSPRKVFDISFLEHIFSWWRSFLNDQNNEEIVDSAQEFPVNSSPATQQLRQISNLHAQNQLIVSSRLISIDLESICQSYTERCDNFIGCSSFSVMAVKTLVLVHARSSFYRNSGHRLWISLGDGVNYMVHHSRLVSPRSFIHSSFCRKF